MTPSTDGPRWLALAGYMGAGKSRVGRGVAARLGCEFVDADIAIEKFAEMPIPEIFSRRGEFWFRRTETKVIRGIVMEQEPGVLALGGGALGTEVTRKLLQREASVVWLKVSPEVAWKRVKGSDRPLASDEGRFMRRAAAREAVYRESADLEVDADAPADDVIDRIARWAESR